MPERDMSPDELERFEEEIVQHESDDRDDSRPASETELLPEEPATRFPVPPPPD